jgi:hypothetical protein
MFREVDLVALLAGLEALALGSGVALEESALS